MALSLIVSSRGKVYLEEVDAGEAASLPLAVAGRIEAAFLRGASQGLLHLGAGELTTDLSQSLDFAYFRDLTRLFMCTACTIPGVAARRGGIRVPLPVALLDELATSVPPIIGGEYLGRDAIASLWADLEGALQDELIAFDGSFGEYLKGKHPLWQRVGRISFHLLEEPDRHAVPFALLLTYTTRVSRHGRLQHAPLGEVLGRLGEDRVAEARLLLPLRLAMRKSDFLRELVEARLIFQRADLTGDQAHRFLVDVPVYEDCGLLVRVPDWWKARRRPQVRVTLGQAPPASLDAEALLDFSISVVLDGQPLSMEERAQLLQGSGGLAQIKGQWIEIDRERLAQVLAHWHKLKRAAAAGLSFSKGLRMIATARGAPDPLAADAGPSADDFDDTEVVEGPWLEQVMEGLRHPETLAEADPGPELKVALRPYQKAGVRWLWLLHCLGLGACLADDMGLGKTIQVLALLLLRRQHGSPGLSLLVVPASLIGNWRSELSRFAPSLRLLCAHPSATPRAQLLGMSGDDLDDLDVVLTSYGSLHRYKWIGETEWGLVVLDEAQAIRNPAAKHSKAVKALRCRARLALSGTPVTNRLADLWSLFDFLNPGLLGSAKAFGQYERRLAESGAYGPLRKLIRRYVLRRLKSDRRVITDLPDKTEVVAPCSLTRKQAALYQQAVKTLEERIHSLGGIQRRGVILSYLMRLKQICNHPSQWLGDGAYAPVESGKFARLGELCTVIAAREQKVLVFTQFRELTGPLSGFLTGIFGRPGLVLHGDTEVGRRRLLCEEFQKDHGPPFFVLSLKAGGTGLNLSAATHVIHFDRWWNPAEENQATDRAYRIGQKNPVLVHKFVCRGTIEERIDELISAKEGLQNEVLDSGGEALLTELSDDQLIGLVSLDIHSAMAEAEG